MSTSTKLLFSFISVLILGVLLLIHSSPPPVDWSPSYEQNDSRPLGSKVFYDLIKTQEFSWRDINRPPFEWIEEAPTEATYVFINRIFRTGPEECGKILEWVRGGGQLFVSAEAFSEIFLDSLSLKSDAIQIDFAGTRSSLMNLESPMILPEAIIFEEIHRGVYFQGSDSLSIATLGHIRSNTATDTLGFLPNFIQLPWGSGLVTLHAFPQSFSNVFLLDPQNKVYTEQVVGTWNPDAPLLFDHYVKDGKNTALSPLYLFLSNKYLKASYFTCWILLVLWVVFEGKRRQKPIRIIQPPKNQSLEFAKTIAGIHLKQTDMTDIGHLQMKLFWNYCRHTFNLPIDEKQRDFAQTLSNKSGVDRNLTESVVRQLSDLAQSKNLQQKDIRAIYEAIERFKNQEKHGRIVQNAR